jgi:hypothetical protein
MAWSGRQRAMAAWRNGIASDYDWMVSGDCRFDPCRGHFYCSHGQTLFFSSRAVYALLYHFLCLIPRFCASVPLPLAPLTPCSSSNFFFAYRFASASSTSSSTSVRFRSARVKLSLLAVPNGVVDGMMVPICTPTPDEQTETERRYCGTHGEIFRQPPYPPPLPLIFPIKPLRIKLIPQPKRFDFSM